jgi:peptidoglycan glycosyltransferase
MSGPTAGSGSGGGSRQASGSSPGGGSRPGFDASPPIGRTAVQLGLALVILYTGLGLGIGYWQVLDAEALTTDPMNPLVIQEREAPRGQIVDARGVVLADTRDGQRTYRDANMANVIGYSSRRFGTAGLERTYDAELIGLASGSPTADMLRKFQRERFQPQTLHLSIDVRLQDLAAKLLGDQRGAVVALEPGTGRILAFVSTPTFDPNAIADPSRDEATMKRLQGDPAAPLLDRAAQGRYVPGSIFKLVSGMAALENGAVTPETTYPNQPKEETTGYLVGGFRVQDGHHLFTGSTALDFYQALEVSCNIYFAHTAVALGGGPLRTFADGAGFDAPIPFELPTASSQVTGGEPGPDGGFKDVVEVANAGYGQAEVLVTPLQMALVAGAVANGGTIMRPRIVDALESADGSLHEFPTQSWRRIASASTISVMHEAMVRAVETAWGSRFTGEAKVPGVTTAGKSGTAELGPGQQPHSWFVGFAPAEDPKIVVAVIVEHGGHGAVRAVPLAGDLMTYYLTKILQ